MICIRNTLAAVPVALALAACGGGSSSPAENSTRLVTTSLVAPVVTPDPVADPVPTGPAGLVFLADGSTLRAATITATGYTETGSAAIPAAGLVANHQIFGLVVHPGKRWVYVASASQSWGNAQLSRFAIDWTTGALSYVDSTLMTAAPGPSCAASDGCAPVGLGITSDGNRLIVEENWGDTYLTYAIGSDGALSFVTEAASSITNYHGVGINAAGTYVYSGAAAYSRAGDAITALNNGGSMGNVSIVLNIGGTETLYTTLDLTNIAVLSLADPANPAVVSSLNPDPLGGNSSIFMDVTENGRRMIAVGENSIAIVDFDGTALVVKNQIAPTGRARGAAFNADGSLAVVSFVAGGAKLYTVAADGTLGEVGSVTSTNPTRAVVFSTRP